MNDDLAPHRQDAVDISSFARTTREAFGPVDDQHPWPTDGEGPPATAWILAFVAGACVMAMYFWGGWVPA